MFSDCLTKECIRSFTFFIYIIDLKMACSNELLLYANDAAIIVSHERKENVENELSREIEGVSKWFCHNKRSLHLGKTEVKLFGSVAKLKKKML